MNKKLFKISAKEAFKNLRKSGPCFCEEISDKIEITGVFWHHLIFSKDRNNLELQEKMLIINIIPRIFKKGYIQQIREKYIRIALDIEEIRIILIFEKTSTKYILLSCFRETQKK